MRQLDFFRRLLFPAPKMAPAPPLPVESGDPAPLQEQARTLLLKLGRPTLAAKVVVRWNPRMRSTAGTAHHGKSLISLNPRLQAFGPEEVERTLLHELAHLLAQARAGRRRIAPHGAEWRLACSELGLRDEPRCHDLPLPRRQLARKYVYACPTCRRQLRRVRPLRRKAACTACCRAHNHGCYSEKFRFARVV